MGSSCTGPFSSWVDKAPRLVRGLLSSALQLKDLDRLYSDACGGAGSFSETALELLNITTRVSAGDLNRVPKSGALVIVANHPFGLLDGLLLDSLLRRIRGDYKILANSLLSGVAPLQDRCIPVDVLGGGGKAANAASLRAAVRWLKEGHAIAMFPAGEVSHWRREHWRVLDAPWNRLPVHLAKLTNAAVAPVYISGGNGVGFQVAGMVHPRLRTIRLPGELLNKSGHTVDVRIGSLIRAADLAKRGCEQQAIAFLRGRTYILKHRAGGARLNSSTGVGGPTLPETVLPEATGIRDAIVALDRSSAAVMESGSYAVYRAQGITNPAILNEIGRLRELTFRDAGEGTGRATDLDSFDSYYTHLILWHKEDTRIAGAYRLVWTQDVLPHRGARGLYTSTLFRLAPGFFSGLGPAVELGRSFIRREYQREYTPLLLLWQAIARCVSERPEAAALFGAVSISGAYSEASRPLIAEFLRRNRLNRDLAAFVEARRPFASRIQREPELRMAAATLMDFEDLNGAIRDLEKNSGVPVLLRQYDKLGGRIVGFNIDENFSNVLDVLLAVDLRETHPRVLGKYMGTERAAAFLQAAERNKAGAQTAGRLPLTKPNINDTRWRTTTI